MMIKAFILLVPAAMALFIAALELYRDKKDREGK